MRAAYVSTYDPANPAVFGGRGYHMFQCLENEFSLERLGPLSWKRYLPLLKTKALWYKHLVRKRYSADRDQLLVRDFARQISSKMSSLQVDIVFSPMSPGSQPVSYLECDQPIVIWTDATLAGAMDLYPELSRSNLCKETIKDGLANEKAALERCSLAIYSSDWAAQTAIKSYDLDPLRVKVVPFGPSLDCDRTLDDVRTMVSARRSDRCKLLFIGGGWERKGGDIALEIARALNETGLHTELTVVGADLPVGRPIAHFVRPLGYISYSTESGTREINRLFSESHFLILPTRADCTPLVLSEAGSFGVPCITTNVGGIPTIIREGLNGKVFAREAGVAEYCTYISDVFCDYSRYEKLALASFNEYESRLNWSVAGERVTQLVGELCPK